MIWITHSQTSQICTSHTMSYIVVKRVKDIVHQYKDTERAFFPARIIPNN